MPVSASSAQTLTPLTRFALVIAGFLTGGSLAVRGGFKAARNSAIMCGVFLAVIEGVGIGFQRMMADNTKLEVSIVLLNNCQGSCEVQQLIPCQNSFLHLLRPSKRLLLKPFLPNIRDRLVILWSTSHFPSRPCLHIIPTLSLSCQVFGLGFLLNDTA
jgi:hypothetical protein